MLPGQAGYRDISFPGSDAPTWVHQVLRRMHTNLGHPPREVLVRQLATAGASEVAVRAARKLRCETCLRVSPPHQPRTTKAVQACRFNDRVCMDIVYIKDIRGGTHLFLNLVDDGTVYQAATRLTSRSEEAVITALVNGWFTYFGPPDELAIDAEGAFRGMRFETLNAQLNVAVRCVPPDSHWQLGRAERHGQALKYNSARLIHQFAALTPSEVNVCVLMACYAKNRLVRRSGSSPNQWVFGRDPKLPASLLSDGGSIESAQVTADSERLMQLEAIRTQALMNHHRYEAHESLRTALLRKSRPYRGAFTPGQKVAYYRKSSQMGDGEGSIEGYRQGIVLALDRNPSSNVAVNIWIRNSRGRLVQCSPEQCRPIAGEQEWWVPDEQDLEVLKNCDEDLRIHPRAFRAVGDRPSPADDRSLLDKSAEMDKSLNELPADDPSKLDAAFDFGSPVPATPVAPATPTAQAPRPTPLLLDEQGQPVQESPMFSPMMFVPRTPRSSPGTPRTRARSRSTTRTAPMETRAEGGAPEQGRRPSDLALPGPSGTRPSGTAEMERLVSGSDRTNLPGQDPPSDRALPGSHGNSRRASFESGPGLLRQQSQQSGPLPSIDESSQRVARGLKRPPDVAVGELGSTSSAVAKTMTGPNSSTDPTPSQTELESTVHLLFCKDCGEQYRIFPKGVPTLWWKLLGVVTTTGCLVA